MENTKTVRIDLATARTSPQSRVFSGRDRGIAARRIFNLDKYDGTQDIVVVSIPRDTYSMNMSFFLGMFGKSVRRLGRSRFYEKYRFEGDAIHMPSIREAVERALKGSSVFQKRALVHSHELI
jgi:hypothetical protein